MCGISGAFGPSAARLATNARLALDSLRHRGPDANGLYVAPKGHCWLAHNRLSILELSDAGHQPMQLGHRWVVYNGEVYNHSELRAQLPRRQYKGNSDTETVITALATSPRMIEQFEGMFAGAVFSEESRELLLFRDTLGIKPLFYSTLNDGTLVFASEIKAILAILGDRIRRVNLETLSCYLRFENYPSAHSLFDGIHSLPPGGLLRATIDDRNLVEHHLEIFKYRAKDAAPIPEGDLLVSTIATKLDRSVELHLLSDRPVGVFLSGGIDSSLVAESASRKSTDLIGFTGYFDTGNDWYDERPYVRMVAKRLQIRCEEIAIGPSDFTSEFDRLIYHLDQPRMGMGAFSQAIVARSFARQRPVALSGHGGDELFFGYPSFRAFQALEKGANRLKLLLKLLNPRKREWPFLAWATWRKLQGRGFIFAPEIRGRGLSETLQKEFSCNDSLQLTDKLARYYRDVYIPGLLEIEDRVSMSYSLETRTPLWSQELVAFAERIPAERKMPGGELKHLLRSVARSRLPTELLSAPKRGFPTPLRLWFRKELKGFVRERLLDRRSDFLDSIESRDNRERLLKSHENLWLPNPLDERRAHRIWQLLCLESWQRQYSVEGWKA